MTLLNPWRLALLFLVSGAATAFIAARMAPGKLADSRTIRLLAPLMFGIMVIVAPQSYYEVVEKAGFKDGFLAFYARYLTADPSFCRGKDCLVVPTWNHLWFVAYLWVYTMAIALVLRFAPAWRERAAGAVSRALTGWGVIAWPWLALALARIFLIGRFPSTHDLIHDWYNHALYFTVFALGFLVARADAVWAAMEARRWHAFVLALASYAFIAWYFFGRADPLATPEWLRTLQRSTRSTSGPRSSRCAASRGATSAATARCAPTSPTRSSRSTSSTRRRSSCSPWRCGRRGCARGSRRRSSSRSWRPPASRRTRWCAACVS
jgi:glucan biosynthesis protein C